MEEQEEKRKSKYSSGVNILIRLDELWKDVNNHCRAGSFSKWNADLDRIWCELARDLSDKEMDDEKDDKGNIVNEGYRNKFEKFDEEIKKIGRFDDNIKVGFRKIGEEQIEKRNKHYKILMKKELFLRRLENYLGKGTTLEDEEGYDME